MLKITYWSLVVVALGIFVKPTHVNAAERAIEPAQQGSWQLFWLPDSVLTATQKKQNIKLYLSFLPPHAKDLASDYAPCWSPPRLILGYVDTDGKVSERLVQCLHYCDESKPIHGSLLYAEGVHVTTKDNNELVVTVHYKKRTFTPPNGQTLLTPSSTAPPSIEKFHYKIPTLLNRKAGTMACGDQGPD